MTTNTNAPTLTQAAFNSLSDAEQLAFYQQKGTVVEGLDFDDEGDIEEEFEEGESESTGKTSADFNLEGAAAFANIITTIGGKVFRIKGHKLTELSTCMDEWDATTKSWGSTHGPTMAIVNMLRTHGAETINRLQTSVVEFRQQGEKDVAPQEDIVAKLLAAEAEAANPTPVVAAAPVVAVAPVVTPVVAVTESPYKETVANEIIVIPAATKAEETKLTAEQTEYAEFLAFKAAQVTTK